MIRSQHKELIAATTAEEFGIQTDPSEWREVSYYSPYIWDWLDNLGCAPKDFLERMGQKSYKELHINPVEPYNKVLEYRHQDQQLDCYVICDPEGVEVRALCWSAR